MPRGSKPLVRRSELAPGQPPARRVPLRPVSDRREAERIERDQVRAFVFWRDQNACRLAHLVGIDDRVPACIGVLTAHHIRKAGQGGPYVPLNLVTLCAGHNVWLETAAGARYGLGCGLVLHRAGDLIECWATMRAAGIVAWNHAGE
jgi:hypothetical protein